MEGIMNTQKGFQFPIKPWMGILGLLGFWGLYYFAPQNNGNPGTLAFFGFFSFFSFYWAGKLSKEKADERLVANQLKAQQIAAIVPLVLLFTGNILLYNYVGRENPEKAYAILIAAISLSFALSLNLASFLTYRFDQKG